MDFASSDVVIPTSYIALEVDQRNSWKDSSISSQLLVMVAERIFDIQEHYELLVGGKISIGCYAAQCAGLKGLFILCSKILLTFMFRNLKATETGFCFFLRFSYCIVETYEKEQGFKLISKFKIVWFIFKHFI